MTNTAANTEAVANIRKGLEMAGYQHVHTWRDGYGNHTVHVFQRPTKWGEVDAVCLSLAHGRVRVRAEDSQDYLLAQEVEASDDAIEIVDTESICGTASTTYYAYQGGYVAVFWAAGHGKQAYRVQNSATREKLREQLIKQREAA